MYRLINASKIHTHNYLRWCFTICLTVDWSLLRPGTDTRIHTHTITTSKPEPPGNKRRRKHSPTYFPITICFVISLPATVVSLQNWAPVVRIHAYASWPTHATTQSGGFHVDNAPGHTAILFVI